MKGVCHASFSTIRKFIRDVVGIKVSRGYLRKLIAKMSDALKPSHDELLAALPDANTLNIDQTGHKDKGDRFWTWCFRAGMYTLFRIDKSRGSKVLIDVRSLSRNSQPVHTTMKYVILSGKPFPLNQRRCKPTSHFARPPFRMIKSGWFGCNLPICPQ